MLVIQLKSLFVESEVSERVYHFVFAPNGTLSSVLEKAGLRFLGITGVLSSSGAKKGFFPSPQSFLLVRAVPQRLGLSPKALAVLQKLCQMSLRRGAEAGLKKEPPFSVTVQRWQTSRKSSFHQRDELMHARDPIKKSFCRERSV